MGKRVFSAVCRSLRSIQRRRFADSRRSDLSQTWFRMLSRVTETTKLAVQTDGFAAPFFDHRRMSMFKPKVIGFQSLVSIQNISELRFFQ
eukprot:s39_g26.t1